MNTFTKYFGFSAAFTVVAMIGGFFLDGVRGATTVAILGILEVSLSFDNAVVNAAILENWSAFWQKCFLYIGFWVAVVGMRLTFPLLIVGMSAHMNMLSVFNLALHNPTEYARLLTSTHNEVAAFGGAFLLMIFLKFFMDAEKDSFWFSPIEKPLAKFGQLEGIQALITLGVVTGVSYLVPHEEQLSFLLSGVVGLMSFIAAKALGSILGGEEGATQIVKQGVAGLLYIELLDASFSFDGVIGAFAVSNQLFLIALGLGIGACFVRSLTIVLVEKKTLTEYQYLESGAFWAIGILTAIMFVSVKVEVSNVFTGLVGAGIILVALVASIVENKKQKPKETLEELREKELSA